MNFPTIWPHFFTATILNWKHLLEKEEYKDIITNCLKFLVDDKRIELNAFAVMANHVHIIWQPLQNYSLSQIQYSFMTKTAKEIKKKLTADNPSLLEEFRVNKYDRMYHPDGFREET